MKTDGSSTWRPTTTAPRSCAPSASFRTAVRRPSARSSVRHRRSARRGGGSHGGMSGIPLQGPAEPFPQLDLRLPPDPFADLHRVEVLAVYLSGRVPGPAVLRPHLARPALADQLADPPNSTRPAPPRVESLPADLP